MNEIEMKNLVEAALLAAGRPVTTQQLIELFEERDRPPAEQVLAALNQLQADYQARGLEVAEVSSGWRIQVRGQCIEYVSRLWQERPSRYSRALLETLALIAYRQPITRGEIEEIRGVAVASTIMRTLHERNWIRVIGHREVPGRPEILATTKEFLDYFGLKSLEDLPPLAELKDLETVGVQLEFNTGDPSPGDKDRQGPQLTLGQVLESTAADGEHEGEDVAESFETVLEDEAVDEFIADDTQDESDFAEVEEEDEQQVTAETETKSEELDESEVPHKAGAVAEDELTKTAAETGLEASEAAQ